MNESTAIARAESSGLEHSNHELAVLPGSSPEVFKAQIEREEAMRRELKEYVRRNMKAGYHYLTKLGTVDLPKPMLTQEGTRNICSLFKLFFGVPVTTEERLPEGHYRVRSHIRLMNAEGRQIASGDAVCSTMEPKYRYRKGDRVCPDCGKDRTIIKGKSQYGGGWVCYANKGGCGAKFDDADDRITSQQLGRVENEDKAELENTVLKMSIKRAKVAAVCDVAMVSEIFAPESDDAARERQSERERAKPPQADEPGPAFKDASPAVFDPQNAMAERAAELAGKLQKNHGVKFDDLKAQFLPEGVGKFSDLTEDQAAGVVPGLAELLTAKVNGR